MIQSPLKIYWNRPVEFEEFSLFRLNLSYKFVNGRWSQCKKENIIRIWPRPSALRGGPQWEEFCRVKVLLHVWHRNLQKLTKNDEIT